MPRFPILTQRLQPLGRAVERTNAYAFPIAAAGGTYYGLEGQVEDPVARALISLAAGSFAQPRAFAQAWKGRNSVPHSSAHLAAMGKKMDPISGFLEGIKPAMKTKAALSGLALVPALATSMSSTASNISKTTAEALKATEGATKTMEGASKFMDTMYEAGKHTEKMAETNANLDLASPVAKLEKVVDMVPGAVSAGKAAAKDAKEAMKQFKESPLNHVLGGAAGAGLGIVAGNTMGALFQDPSGNSAEDKQTRRRNARIRAMLTLGAGAAGGFSGYRIGQGKNPLDDLARLKGKAAGFMTNFTR